MNAAGTSAGGDPSTLGNTLAGNLTWRGDGSLTQLALIDGFNSTSGQNYGNSQVCSYTHDDLGRLSTVECGSSKWGQNFTYDVYSNAKWTIPSGHLGTSFTPTYNSNNRIST